MDITIREATLEDISTLLQINLSSFEANATYDPHIDMNWVHSDHARKHFTEAVTKEDRFSLIGEAGGVSIGYIILEPKNINYRTAKTVELSNMAVLPDYRSSGVGALLMQSAKEWVKEHGYQTIMVNAYITNDRAVAFYKKHGFAPIDISLEYDVV